MLHFLVVALQTHEILYRQEVDRKKLWKYVFPWRKKKKLRREYLTRSDFEHYFKGRQGHTIICPSFILLEKEPAILISPEQIVSSCLSLVISTCPAESYVEMFHILRVLSQMSGRVAVEPNATKTNTVIYREKNDFTVWGEWQEVYREEFSVFASVHLASKSDYSLSSLTLKYPLENHSDCGNRTRPETKA